MAAVQALGDAADDVAAFATKSVKIISSGLGKAIRPRLKRDTGGDNRMSGIGGAKLSVTVRTKGPGKTRGTVAAAPRRLAGPWRWLDDGTRPHTTHGGTRRHPGTRAKRTWSDPVDRNVDDLQREVAAEWGRVFR